MDLDFSKISSKKEMHSSNRGVGCENVITVLQAWQSLLLSYSTLFDKGGNDKVSNLKDNDYKDIGVGYWIFGGEK